MNYIKKDIIINAKINEFNFDLFKKNNYSNCIFCIDCKENLKELEKIKKLNVLIIGIPNKKVLEYNFNKYFNNYLWNTNQLSKTNINNHFFIHIKLIKWNIPTVSIDRHRNITSKCYLSVELPNITDCKTISLNNNIKLPCGIKKIFLQHNIINIFNDNIMTQLNNLEELYIYFEIFNLSIDNLPIDNLPIDNLPPSLKIISICSKNFAKSINTLPENLKYLYINSKLDCLPNRLKVLSICSFQFTHELNNLPLGLEILHLYISNGIICSFDYLPETLLYLYLSGSYIKSDLSNLPIGLENVYIDINITDNTLLPKYQNLPQNIKQKIIK